MAKSSKFFIFHRSYWKSKKKLSSNFSNYWRLFRWFCECHALHTWEMKIVSEIYPELVSDWFSRTGNICIGPNPGKVQLVFRKLKLTASLDDHGLSEVMILNQVGDKSFFYRKYKFPIIQKSLFRILFLFIRLFTEFCFDFWYIIKVVILRSSQLID